MYASAELPLIPFSVVYYSNGRISRPLQQYCLNALATYVARSGGEILCVTWESLDFDAPALRNVIWPHHDSTHRNMYGQILLGISEAQSDLIMLAEHDVLYPEGYHEAMLAIAAKGGLCYNKNIWCLNSLGFFRSAECDYLSNCGGQRDVLIQKIHGKIEEIEVRGYVDWAEPPADARFSSPNPTVDIRHGQNFTGTRQAPGGQYCSQIRYWGSASIYTPLF